MESIAAINSLFYITHLARFASAVPKCSIYEIPCLANLAQNYANSLISGGYRNLNTESLDPMFLAPIHVEQDGLNSTMSEIEVRGLGGSIFEKVQFDKQARKIHFKARVPYMTISGHAASEGYLQRISFVGEGAAAFNLYDVENDLTMDYEVIKGYNGKEYLQLNKYYYWFDIRNVESYFENINKDSPLKALETDLYLTKEFSSIWQQFGRHFFNKLNDKIFETMKQFLLTTPAEDLLYDY